MFIAKKSLCTLGMALLGKWVAATVIATPFLAEVVALPVLLLMCHRGTGLPPLQHALSGYTALHSVLP